MGLRIVRIDPSHRVSMVAASETNKKHGFWGSTYIREKLNKHCQIAEEHDFLISHGVGGIGEAPLI